jgi:hypothetical protein
MGQNGRFSTPQRRAAATASSPGCVPHGRHCRCHRGSARVKRRARRGGWRRHASIGPPLPTVAYYGKFFATPARARRCSVCPRSCCTRRPRSASAARTEKTAATAAAAAAARVPKFRARCADRRRSAARRGAGLGFRGRRGARRAHAGIARAYLRGQAPISRPSRVIFGRARNPFRLNASS